MKLVFVNDVMWLLKRVLVGGCETFACLGALDCAFILMCVRLRARAEV